MKTRRLSEIDLARLASIPRGENRDQALRKYNVGGGAWSYNPVRSSTADILQAKTPLLGGLGTAPWEHIEPQIRKACTRGAQQIEANVQVGHVLYDGAARMGWSAVKFPMGRLPIGFGESVAYWSDIVLADDQGTFIPYFDHRRSAGVTSPKMRQIVFSMQHIWVRDRHPDLYDARLVIVQFPPLKETRSIKLTVCLDTDLLPYDVLNSMVSEVYEDWARISAERSEQSRSTGTRGQNPFGF